MRRLIYILSIALVGMSCDTGDDSSGHKTGKTSQQAVSEEEAKKLLEKVVEHRMAVQAALNKAQAAELGALLNNNSNAVFKYAFEANDHALSALELVIEIQKLQSQPAHKFQASRLS